VLFREDLETYGAIRHATNDDIIGRKKYVICMPLN